MATAKKATTEATATDAQATAEKEILAERVQAELSNVRPKPVKGKFYEFESKGKSKYLKKGKRYLLTLELFELFTKKGY
jgi:hypothetical protein